MTRLNEVLTENLMREILQVDFHQAKELIDGDNSDSYIAQELKVNPLTVGLLRDGLS